MRSVFFLPSGPGDPAALLDSIEAILASDGDASQVLVVDDCSVAARESVVRERFPQVDVVKRRIPTGGPPNIWRSCRDGLERALERYDFEQWVKSDTDALVVGPRFSDVTLARVAAAPGAGIAGSYRVRADGAPEDHRYHAEVLARSLRWDRTLAAAVERARATGWRLGDPVQGGILTVTRPACEGLAREGWLGWRRRWHSLVPEDLALTIFVLASGFEALSIGGPDGIFAVANKGLPLSKEGLAAGPWVAAHSTRVGLNGEDEATLRAYFRADRERWGAERPRPAPSG